jgi:hypothetical protein
VDFFAFDLPLPLALAGIFRFLLFHNTIQINLIRETIFLITSDVNKNEDVL